VVVVCVPGAAQFWPQLFASHESHSDLPSAAILVQLQPAMLMWAHAGLDMVVAD
jgi:hypothetical protein